MGKRLLDIGFGSGNNLLFLAGKGFECYGVDVSRSAVEIATVRLSKAGLKAEIRQIDRNRYPFDDGFFDLVVAWGVLSYNDEPGLTQTLSEIDRVLKPKGVLLATFPTPRDFAVSRSRAIGKHTFELVCDTSNQDGAIIMAVESEAAVRETFRVFDNLDIGYSEISVKGITNSHWLVYGNKNQSGVSRVYPVPA